MADLNWSLYQRQPTGAESIMQGLQVGSGISGQIQQYQQQEQQMLAQKRQQDFNAAFGQAYQSGDKEAITALAGTFPEQFKFIKEAAGFQDEQKNSQFGNLGLQLKSLIDSGNTEAAGQVIAGNADFLRQAGPGYEPEGLIQQLQQDPQGLARRADAFSLTALGPEKYYEIMGGREKNATTQRGQDLTAQTAIRGQDIGAQTTMRGQDIQSANAAADRSIAGANLGLRQQEVQIKALEAQNKGIDRTLARETNELKRQELQQKLEQNTIKANAAKSDRDQKAATSISNFESAVQTIDSIKNHKGLDGNFGKMSYLPNIRGSDSSDAAALIENLKGKAFLTAFESLKGAGQITETEGTKATNAQLNMENSQSKESFLKNLAIFEDVVKTGLERAKKTYGNPVQNPPAQQAGSAPAAGGIKFLGFE